MLFWPKPKKSYILYRKGGRNTIYGIWYFILLWPSRECDFKKGKMQRENSKKKTTCAPLCF